MHNLLILCILAIIPFPLTYIIPYPIAILYLLPVFYQIIKTIKGKPVFLKDKTTEVLSFLCLIFFIFDIFVISRRLIIVAIHLTLGLILIKIFNLKTKKDNYLLLLLLFFIISAGIANSFHILLIPYLLICIFYFSKFLLEENNIENKKANFFSSLTIFFGIIISVPLFVFFPRVKTPYIPGISFAGESIAYNENSLNLNDIENLKAKNDIVMRIKFEKKIEKSKDIYIRLKSFSQFSNGIWSQPKPDFKLYKSEIFGLFKFSDSEKNYEVEFFSRTFFQNLPLLYGTASIEIPIEFINISRDGSILLPSAFQKRRLKYKVFVSKFPEIYNAKEPNKDEINSADIAGIRNLASNIIGETVDKKERAEKILIYLSKNYSYGIESKNLQEFLFEKKIGHCELFASACVLLMREAGIPSRIVVGFLGGEKHPWQNYLIIRGSNSHAWVEAWVDGKWHIFDPTPPSFRPQIVEGNIGAFFKYFFETISFFWDRNILGFTYSEQVQILNFLKSNLNLFLKILYYFSLITFIFFLFIIFKKIKIKREKFYLKYYKNLRNKMIKKLKLPKGICPEKLSFILKELKPQKTYFIENFFKLYLEASFGGRRVNKENMKYFYKKIKL